MRLLVTLTLVALLVPTYAHAVPVTFAFTATGALYGSYTFETSTPGVRHDIPATDGSFAQHYTFYTDAISRWDVHIADSVVASGTEGDILLSVEGGELEETFYTVSMRTGPNLRLFLNIWSPTGDAIITSEDLAAAEVPITGIEGNIHEATLFDGLGNGPGNVTRDERVTNIRRVPEPSSALLFGLAAFIVASSKRAMSRFHNRQE